MLWHNDNTLRPSVAQLNISDRQIFRQRWRNEALNNINEKKKKQQTYKTVVMAQHIDILYKRHIMA